MTGSEKMPRKQDCKADKRFPEGNIEKCLEC